MTYNDVQLTHTMLLDLLDDLQQRTRHVFGGQIRLFVHGGAVLILHPSLSTSSTRTTTRDVDYIRRAFGHEWRKKGVYDAEDRLQDCIDATAHRFRIGTDWMNADPDVALPFSRDPQGQVYDPIYYDSKQSNNIEMNTIYVSPGLTLVSVTMFWAVALKLVRYRKDDPADIVAMLRHGTRLNGVQWTPQIMENWVKTLCWPMGYESYQPHRMDELRDRIRDAVRLLQNESVLTTSHVPVRRRSMHIPHQHRHSPPHAHLPAPSLDLAAFVPHCSVSHTRNPLGNATNSMHVSVPDPWLSFAPMMPNTGAF